MVQHAISVDLMAESDEDLAMEYLGCKETVSDDGVTTFAFVPPGSEREKQCRKALGRLLRGRAELSIGIRWRLATLFDALDDLESRELRLVRRKKGGANDPVEIRGLLVAELIAEQVNANRSIESALDLAEQRFGIDRRTAQRAWKRHGAEYVRRQKSTH